MVSSCIHTSKFYRSDLMANRWHILTAFGVYCYLVFVEYLRHALLSERSKSRSRLLWKMYIIPHLEVADDGKRL